MTTSTIPFGPQHPVLPEPIHISLTLDNETVVGATPALGYVHRGLETLCSVRDYKQMVQVCERVCGICSHIHAIAYCETVETMLGTEVPDRAKFLRIVWGELHRLHSHLLWLGLHADAFGFENLFYQYWKVREKVMDLIEATTGNRVIMSVCEVGGVRRDLSPEQTRHILSELAIVEEGIKELGPASLDDITVRKRTVGIGVITGAQALELGAVGPTLRGSGVAQDCRQLGYECLGQLDFEPVTQPDGDAYSRAKVRYLEALQCIDLVRQALARMPEGELAVKPKGYPEGEAVIRVEQPRGELMYYARGNGTKHLDRLRIRTPTFANIPPLTAMLPGCQLADVPVIVLSIDPCISCTER